MTTVYVVMGNDFPDGFVFEDEQAAEEYVKGKMDDPENRHPLRGGPRVYWRTYPAVLKRKKGKGTPGTIQRAVLNALLDGEARNFEQLSAKIAADQGRRYAVSQIHAATSGMVNMGGRHWLEQKGRTFTITDGGREILLVAF